MGQGRRLLGAGCVEGWISSTADRQQHAGKSRMNSLQTLVFPPYQKSHKYMLQLLYLIPGGPEKKLQMILLFAWFQKPAPYK